MDLKDMILVIENDRGTETNMLMTLDDYKSFIAIDDMSELADNLLQLGRTPVSYTHLDVYKRQVLSRISLSSRESVIRITIFLRKFHMPRERRKRRLRKSWMMSVRMKMCIRDRYLTV